MELSYDIRVRKISTYKGKRGNTYRVRWAVAMNSFGETFATKALAESFRSRIIIAQREGIAFDQLSGLPEPEARRLNSVSWLSLLTDFVDMKWPHAAPKQRANIAETLACITPAMVNSERGAPSDSEIRSTVYRWTANKVRRDQEVPPDSVSRIAKWLENNTVDANQLAQAPLIRKALDRLSLKQDGKPAAATTIARRRAILNNILRYAVERRLIDSHPFAYVAWKAPKGDDQVDRRTVVNPGQAKTLLAAVQLIDAALVAFFGCMYYAALRPEEVLHLTTHSYSPPVAGETWGWFELTGATVTIGTSWSGTESVHHDQGLKHRARSATRRVPVAPQLVALLDDHINTYRVPDGGRLFVSRRGANPGKPVGASTYLRVWRAARESTLTPEQQESPLAKVPYHLRHAAVSLWLNAGVPAPQIAEWAGHSLHVLLKVYAKCIDGQEAASRRRIEAALASTWPTGDDETGDDETLSRIWPNE